MRLFCLPLPDLRACRTWVGVLFFAMNGLPASRADELAEKKKNWGIAFEEKIKPIIQDRCLGCHNAEKSEGEFDLSKWMTAETAVEAGDAWERVARRVRQNEMPPEGSPGLNDSQKGAFHQWVDARPDQDLCSQLASDETEAWYQGHVMSRRLTRAEYRYAIEDLTGVVLLPNEGPPSDGAGGEGFDTAGDALFTSPIHLEAYLSVADRVVDQMINDRSNELRQHENEAGIRKVIETFARCAWRRPPNAAEIDRLMTLGSVPIQGNNEPSRESWLARLSVAMKAILLSPNFLVVVDQDSQSGGVQRLSAHELATRLALFIWSSVPDKALLSKADSGELLEEAVVRVEVRRMLQDPKVRRLGENFGLQWLGLRNFDQVRPDASLFPEYDGTLAGSMREETVRFVSGIFQEDRSLNDLIAANYTYVDSSLAKHYGFTGELTAPWQRVTWSDGKRGGVATMASVLTSSSYPRRTSPVLRGRWLLQELLGSSVPPPPAGVPALEEAGPDNSAQTLRQRLELHRKQAECASCHNRMDPLGFGLENFDAIGRWRDSDAGLPIDSTGTLPSGETFQGPQELKASLMNRAGEFHRHFVRKMLGFALGRPLNKFDACVVDRCLKKLGENDYRAAILVEEIALSYPFQHRYYQKSDSQESK